MIYGVKFLIGAGEVNSCKFHDCTDAIYEYNTDPADWIKIRYNEFTDCSIGYYGSAGYSQLNDNLFDGCTNAIRLLSSSACQIYNNTIQGGGTSATYGSVYCTGVQPPPSNATRSMVMPVSGCG